MAKRYFAEHAVEYREVNVVTDPKGRREMVLMTGQNGVPVIRVGDRAIIGWDKREFEVLRTGRQRRR